MVSPIQVLVKVSLSHTFHKAQMGCKFITTPSRIIDTTCEWSTSRSGLFTHGNKTPVSIAVESILFMCPDNW